MADQLGIIAGRSCSAVRFADAMLQTLGGVQVTLRLSDPSSGDTSSQLGLEAPTAEDLSVSPAAVKMLEPVKDGNRRMEIVVSVMALRVAAKNYGIEDISAWLLSMQGVVTNGGVWRIATVIVDKVCGADCLYHLTATE
ncbi:MAG TPA: hypothetical protein VK976_06975 [Verrucomicrobiae bacterium]|jgi:hypothetical protein|nr:hypothetical protein [Verrucomicrobiae bacterium]